MWNVSIYTSKQGQGISSRAGPPVLDVEWLLAHLRAHFSCPSFPLKHTSRVTGESTPPPTPAIDHCCRQHVQAWIRFASSCYSPCFSSQGNSAPSNAKCFGVKCQSAQLPDFHTTQKSMHRLCYFRQLKLKSKNSNCISEQEETIWDPNGRQAKC